MTAETNEVEQIIARVKEWYVTHGWIPLACKSPRNSHKAVVIPN